MLSHTVAAASSFLVVSESPVQIHPHIYMMMTSAALQTGKTEPHIRSSHGTGVFNA